MRNAIFYLTYNGLYNFTNGIGTQTQLLISGLEVLREMLVRRYGPIDVHVACPAPDTHTWGYDHAFFSASKNVLRKSMDTCTSFRISRNPPRISGKFVPGRPSVKTSHRCYVPRWRPMSGR